MARRTKKKPPPHPISIPDDPSSLLGKVPIPDDPKKRTKKLTYREKVDRMKKVRRGEIGKTKPTDSNRAALLMAEACARKHAKYVGSRVTDWMAALEKRGRLACCMRASIQADMLQAPYAEYVEAQYYWFNDYFQRAPRYSEIAASGSLVRYKSWKALQEKRDIPARTVHPALAGGRVNPAETPPDVVLRYEEQILRRMVRRLGSEEAVWELCGRLGEEEVFSDAFKKTRPIWQATHGGKT